jgi:hypothetical protein
MYNGNKFVKNNEILLKEEPTFNFDGGESFLDFGDDMDYDNFLVPALGVRGGLNMRDRNRRKKELMAGGQSKAMAKRNSLEQLPRATLKSVLAKLKRGETVSQVGGVQLGSVAKGKLNRAENQKQAIAEVSDALSMGANTSDSSETMTSDSSETMTSNPSETMTSNPTDTNENSEKKGFFAKNKMYIGIGAIVLVLGFFAYKKFSKK